MIGLLEAFLLGLFYSWSGIGPVVMEVIRRGLRHGFWSAFAVSLGATVVDFIWLAAIFAGVSQFANVPIFKTMLWFLGFIFLVYLGLKAVKDYRNGMRFNGKTTQRNSIVAGFLLGLSSPEGFIFYIGIFGPIAASSSMFSAIAIGLLIILGLLFGEFLIALLAHFGKKVLTTEIIRYASLASGISLVLFGLYFGYQGLLSI